MKQLSLFSGQAGAALITSLIFLSVLTILGMSTLGTALLESRMAGNARDRNIAFQAAEIGLRDAELFIRDSGRIVGNIVQELGVEAGNYTLQECELGVCYNGTAWDANGTNWITPSNQVWKKDEFWVYAIQYQNDTSAVGKVIGYGAEEILSIDATHIPPYVLPAELPLVSRQPEYLIETFPQKPGDNRFYYRITVRGYGMRGGTRVLLQEVFTP